MNYFLLWIVTGLVTASGIIIKQLFFDRKDFKMSEVLPALLAVVLGPLTLFIILLGYSDGSAEDFSLIKAPKKKENK